MAALNAHLADFSLNLLRDIGQNQSNAFCSPLSIAIALAMTLAGSGGSTKDELRRTVFGADSSDESIHSTFNTLISDSLALPNAEPITNEHGSVINRHELVKVEIANNLYPSKRLMGDAGIHQSFLDQLHNHYKLDGGLSILDFSKKAEAAKVINGWISEKTNGSIQNLIDPNDLNVNTAAIIVNAIHFKAPWLHPFVKKATSPGLFFKSSTDAGSSLSVMTVTKTFPYFEDPQKSYRLALLPYSNTNFSLFIVLPTQKDGLNGVLSSLSGAALLGPINGAAPRELRVLMPKFKLKQGYKLSSTLERLGITKLFSSADLSGITAAPLYIEEVNHEAQIAVDEDGTEASAATAVRGSFRMMTHPVDFRVEHPFILGVWDKTHQQIMFIGKIAEL